jgi:hypothetical protein
MSRSLEIRIILLLYITASLWMCSSFDRLRMNGIMRLRACLAVDTGIRGF